VSFASLNTPQATDLIARFSDAERLTLVVGAGASIEASLPGWPVLVERLLRRVASADAGLTSEESETEWVRRILESEDLLGAGAIVEAMADTDLDTLLPAELYGPGGPTSVEPGPIAHQTAGLYRCFGEHATLLTTNYDDLLERALLTSGYTKREVRSYVSRHGPPVGAVPVTHLHGYAGRNGKPRKLILTERHYHRMQRGSSWQEECVTERLQSSSCLFVGTSLADPNLVRYLYGYKQSSFHRHAAVFVREGESDRDSDEVCVVRERAAAKRWERCGVECLFVDHFADAAQLLYEIAHRRNVGSQQYEPVAERAQRAIRRIENMLVLRRAGRGLFAENQTVLSDWLRITLRRTLTAALERRLPAGEHFALALWLLSEDGKAITVWAHSDSAYRDPTTIKSLSVRSDSPWIAVRAVCKGVRVELDPGNEFSRWRFVRALPLTLERPTRLPVGCLTIATTRAREQSVLETMEESRKQSLHRSLVDAVVGPLTDLLGG
jgi:hypothetical protein